MEKKEGFLGPVATKSFWWDFFRTLVRKALVSFFETLSGLIGYYAVEKMGKSLLPPVTTTTTQTSHFPSSSSAFSSSSRLPSIQGSSYPNNYSSSQQQRDYPGLFTR